MQHEVDRECSTCVYCVCFEELARANALTELQSIVDARYLTTSCRVDDVFFLFFQDDGKQGEARTQDRKF